MGECGVEREGGEGFLALSAYTSRNTSYVYKCLSFLCVCVCARASACLQCFYFIFNLEKSIVSFESVKVLIFGSFSLYGFIIKTLSL